MNDGTTQREPLKGGGGVYWTADLVPEARPALDEMEQTIAVHQDGCDIHVELSDLYGELEGWGWYFANLISMIASDYVARRGLNRADAYKEILQGFKDFWEAMDGELGRGG